MGSIGHTSLYALDKARDELKRKGLNNNTIVKDDISNNLHTMLYTYAADLFVNTYIAKLQLAISVCLKSNDMNVFEYFDNIANQYEHDLRYYKVFTIKSKGDYQFLLYNDYSKIVQHVKKRIKELADNVLQANIHRYNY